MAVGTALLLLAATPQALAYLGPQTATTPGLIGINAQHEMGTMALPFYSGRVVCINESGGTAGFMDVPHSATPASDVENWGAAWALSDRAGYLSSPSDKKAAALYYFVGVEAGMNANPSEVQRAWDAAGAAGKWADSSVELAALRAEVAAHQGPYDMSKIALAKAGTGGTVTDVGVQSASGTWEAGLPITLTLSGPGLFVSTGTNTMTVTSSSSPLTEAFTFSGGGTVKVTQSTTGLPRYVAIHAAPAAGQQRVVATGALSDLSYNDPLTVTGYAPQLTSQVSGALVAEDTAVSDTLMATGGVPSAPWTGTVDVFAGLASNPKDGIPAGTKPYLTLPISGTFDAAGKSTVTTSANKLPGGFAYFQGHIAATSDWPEFSAPLGTEVTETVLVIAPGLYTTISQPNSKAGDSISDTVTTTGTLPAIDVAGNPITYSLSGSLVQAKCGTPYTAAPVFSFGPVEFVSGQQYGTFVVPESASSQCLSYGEVLSFTSASGSGSVTYAPGQTTETTTVAELGGQIIAGTPVLMIQPAPGVWAGGAAVALGALLAAGMLITRRKDVRA